MAARRHVEMEEQMLKNYGGIWSYRDGGKLMKNYGGTWL